MKANFVGRTENNHTAFIRIKTDKHDLQHTVVLPMEVEVTSCTYHNLSIQACDLLENIIILLKMIYKFIRSNDCSFKFNESMMVYCH
jgi:hypothetical protein